MGAKPVVSNSARISSPSILKVRLSRSRGKRSNGGSDSTAATVSWMIVRGPLATQLMPIRPAGRSIRQNDSSGTVLSGSQWNTELQTITS